MFTTFFILAYIFWSIMNAYQIFPVDFSCPPLICWHFVYHPRTTNKECCQSNKDDKPPTILPGNPNPHKLSHCCKALKDGEKVPVLQPSFYINRHIYLEHIGCRNQYDENYDHPTMKTGSREEGTRWQTRWYLSKKDRTLNLDFFWWLVSYNLKFDISYCNCRPCSASAKCIWMHIICQCWPLQHSNASQSRWVFLKRKAVLISTSWMLKWMRWKPVRRWVCIKHFHTITQNVQRDLWIKFFKKN